MPGTNPWETHVGWIDLIVRSEPVPPFIKPARYTRKLETQVEKRVWWYGDVENQGLVRGRFEGNE
ncbi:unnamed protein product [Arabis nemorensis]|uniref:Uncharacterized protein n=1 Tax=Arabis nemorensis TaxID=586526 RepID=A0A565BEA6_9BRAS|nr:unnamed protein product [Arabis nemorensis]